MSWRSQEWEETRAPEAVSFPPSSFGILWTDFYNVDALCFFLFSVKEYIALGLDKEIIDPDNGANIARKLETLRSSGVDLSKHPNLVPSPPYPDEGWTTVLADLPPVTFGCVYQHFDVPSTIAPSISATAAEEHVAAAVATPLQDPTAAAMHSQHAATPTGNWDEETLSSFRGLSKGFRFFKDGHVQVLEMHPLPDHPQFVYVRASVLPSMVKTRLYNVRVCLTNKGFIHTAYCVCPAGLGGVCNHVAAVGYALADFVEKGLREESRLPCTSRLQKWNRPRQRNVAPRRVADIQVVKEEYGKKKRHRKSPHEDPRPTNMRMPVPQEQDDLREALQAEHVKQLSTDTTGNVEKYGSSCLLKLMASSSEDSDESTSDASSCTSGSDSEEIVTQSVSGVETPDDFFQKFVCVSADTAASIERETREQSKSMTWFSERRKRVTATLVKAVVRRRTPNFAPIVRQKLVQTFRGTKATKYGREHERDALEFAEKVLAENLGPQFGPVAIQGSGLVIDPVDSWLAATPDGVLIADGLTGKALVEVKCPYSARNLTISEAIDSLKSFCLRRDDKGVVTLKSSHSYFYQVQFQMHVCRAQHCFFVVWTPKECHIQQINYDSKFVDDCMVKLRSFYFDELLPALTAEVLR